MVLCIVCNPEDTNVKLRMPVGRKEVLRAKLFSPVGRRAFFAQEMPLQLFVLLKREVDKCYQVKRRWPI